jgi:phosphohistidine phosphatase SixA
VAAGSRYTRQMFRSSWPVALTLTLLLTASASAQSIFLVRHAERADTESGGKPVSGADPDLSRSGVARAESLARLLKDARITAIFVTEYKRTQQTAAPLAKVLGITPTVVIAKDIPALVARLREAKGTALVVGHSNSVPDVMKELGAADVPGIPDPEYDNLFVVTDSRQLLRLRFQ